MPRPKYMKAGASRGTPDVGAGRRADLQRARERYTEALEEINADPDLIESARTVDPNSPNGRDES